MTECRYWEDCNGKEITDKMEDNVTLILKQKTFTLSDINQPHKAK